MRRSCYKARGQKANAPERPRRRFFAAGRMDRARALGYGTDMLKKLYHWTLSLAESRYAPAALGAVAFAESSFFPIPPDALLVPMSVAKPKNAWTYALIATVASVLGGILGYAIGIWLGDLAQWILHFYGYGGDKLEKLKVFYDEWGAWVIILKGLTPVPYKVVTLVSGALKYNFGLFVILSVFTRAARFFILAAILNRYGEPIKDLLDRFFGWFLLILLIFLVAGFWLAARMV